MEALAWSEYQLEVFNAVTSKKNIIIQAVAGSGKTKTIREASKRREANTLALSFNKSIQTENSEFFENCYTFHGHGLMLIKKHTNFKCKVNNNKVMNCINSFILSEQFNGSLHKFAFPYVLLRFVNYFRKNYIEINDTNMRLALDEVTLTTSDTAEIKASVLEKRKKFMMNNTEKIMKLLRMLDDPSEIDIGDMVRLPAVLKLYAKLDYELLVVDEVQDLDPIQLACMIHFNKDRNNQVLFCGDSSQSIYGFRGVAIGGMNFIKEALDLQEMQLPITYRCQSVIVDNVNAFLEEKEYDIRVQAFSAGGAYNKITGNTSWFSDYFKDMDSRGRKIDMIVSAKNSNLLRLYFDLLLGHGYIPLIKGIDVSAVLKNCVSSEKCNTRGELRSAISKYKSDLKNNKNRMNYKTIMILRERIMQFNILAYALKKYQYSSVTELLHRVKIAYKAMKKGKSNICLYTVHGSKGLEADRVVVIDDFFESPETNNMIYVAMTRAKKELVMWTRIQ